jgi:hypothetical protein
MAAVVVVAAVSHGWRPGCVLAACAVIGLGAGALVAAGTGSQTAAGRAGEGESGTSARTGTWRTAVAATFHHPLLGAGPGRFDAATSPRRTLAIARAEGPDRIFTDAHNLILEYTTTTGIPGAIAGIAFAGLAVTAARGPRRTFALAVLAVGLVEPQSVVTTPIAFLALGTAAVWDPGGRQAPMGVRATSAGLAFVAAGAAAALLVGDFHLEQAKLDFGLAQASAAAAWLPPWPEPRGQLAKVYVLRSKARGADTAAEDAQARRWRTAAAERNPTEANLWNDLGDLELATGRVSSAEQHYRLALTRDPWSVRALNGAARARIAQGDPVGAGPFLRRSLLVRPAQPSIVELLHGP